jgi:hypothetical protein
MKARLVALTLVAAPLVVPAGVAGQLNGVPVGSVGLPNPLYSALIGLQYHSTWGDDFVGDDTAADRGFAVTGQLMPGRWTVRGSFGVQQRDVAPGVRATKPQGGVLIGWNVAKHRNGAGNRDIGASVVAGAGYGGLQEGASETNLMVGVDLAAMFIMGGWSINPALLPRWAFRNTDIPTGGWQDGFGLSAEVVVDGSALGLIIAGDLLSLGDGPTRTPVSLSSMTAYAWSVGARFKL